MKLLVFGNSGSGKSTLAMQLSREHNLAYLDLDSIAWLDVKPPRRAPLDISQCHIQQFMDKNTSWVIEGCYTDLLEGAASHASKVIYLNLPIDECIKNAEQRPWEPHKYATKELQDKNLSMLVDWISDYESRTDTFSKLAHSQFYDRFDGEKIMYVSNSRD